MNFGDKSLIVHRVDCTAIARQLDRAMVWRWVREEIEADLANPNFVPHGLNEVNRPGNIGGHALTRRKDRRGGTRETSRGLKHQTPAVFWVESCLASVMSRSLKLCDVHKTNRECYYRRDKDQRTIPFTFDKEICVYTEY